MGNTGRPHDVQNTVKDGDILIKRVRPCYIICEENNIIRMHAKQEGIETYKCVWVRGIQVGRRRTLRTAIQVGDKVVERELVEIDVQHEGRVK